MMVQIRDHAVRPDDSTCEEFQAQMPELLGDGFRDHEHLKTCARCAALLEELEYIASIAKQLLPVHEPGDAVWRKIVASLDEPFDAPVHEPVFANGHLKEHSTDS